MGGWTWSRSGMLLLPVPLARLLADQFVVLLARRRLVGERLHRRLPLAADPAVVRVQQVTLGPHLPELVRRALAELEAPPPVRLRLRRRGSRFRRRGRQRPVRQRIDLDE